MAYSKVGVYGRMQWLLTFVNCVARNSGTYVYYPFAYIVLEQQFLCKQSNVYHHGSPVYQSCSAEDICQNKDSMVLGRDYIVDESYQYYLKNWYLEMDLMCMPAKTIGYMITAYYIGFALGGLFFSMPDKYGRKLSVIFGLVITCVAQIIMLYYPNYWIRMGTFFMMGLSQIKNSVSYVWLSESVPLPKKSMAIISISLFDAIPMAVTCLYFMYISRDWFYLSFFMLILSILATVCAFICPESPRWLLVNGRKEEAIKALNYFARVNGSHYRIPSTANFVEDPTNYQTGPNADGKKPGAQESSAIGRKLDVTN